MKTEERDEYIKYRLEKADETFEVAQLLVANKKWNSAVNRLYYAVYYAVSALLVKYEIEAKTHAGVKTYFFLHFVKTGKIDVNQGKLFADLFDWRQKGDYGDFFDFTEEEVLAVIEPVKALIDAVKKQIEAE